MGDSPRKHALGIQPQVDLRRPEWQFIYPRSTRVDPLSTRVELRSNSSPRDSEEKNRWTPCAWQSSQQLPGQPPNSEVRQKKGLEIRGSVKVRFCWRWGFPPGELERRRKPKKNNEKQRKSKGDHGWAAQGAWTVPGLPLLHVFYMFPKQRLRYRVLYISSKGQVNGLTAPRSVT